MPEVPTLSWEDALLRLALAAVLGGLIGIERELKEHDAGLRTHMLARERNCTATAMLRPSPVSWNSTLFGVDLDEGATVPVLGALEELGATVAQAHDATDRIGGLVRRPPARMDPVIR